ncbi:MAG TPA: DoxX family protein [Gaiellaceae bacterium]|nr:DoxX family protein [Gaiellaceae bacterium]
MDYGILLLRVVVGTLVAAHGGRRLFGWFGGRGRTGTVDYFASLGYRAPQLAWLLVGAAEVAGGLLLALGLVTPLAALLVAVVALSAIAVARWRAGLFVSHGGFELDVVLVTVATAVTVAGPGRVSLDRLIGWDDRWSGVEWGGGMLALALALAFLGSTLGRARPEATELPA